MQPSDSLPPSTTAPVPLAGGLPRCGRLFCASSGRRHVRPQRAVRRRRVAGSPPDRNMSRRGEGLLCGRCCQALLPIFFSPVFSGYCLTSCRATLQPPLVRSPPVTHASIPIRIQKQINTG